MGYNFNMSLSSRIRVAVLRGGQSLGYSTSLKTGEHVLSALREMPEIYEPIDIFISIRGEWHRGGLVEEPHRALRHADVVWNALHGSYGEDGQVQRVLEGLQIPFTGSSAVASALSMNKEMAKRLYKQHSLLTPAHTLITKDNLDDNRLITVFRTYLHPVIVKPVDAVESLGVRKVATFPELKQVVKETLNYSPRVLVEEFIKGDEVSCIVIDDAKGERIYALLPASPELPPRLGEAGQRGEPSSKFRLKLKVEENSPRFGEAGKEIEEMAKRAHEALGLRHYSGSDFIITPKRKIYILETNSLPALHEGSLAHTSLRATGWRSRDFVDHVLKLAM